MSKKHKHHDVSDKKQRIAQITKKRLVILIICLITGLALLIFAPGKELWPAWMIDSRKTLILILGTLSVFLTFMSPIIVVTESDPRPLSGPGKNPKTGDWQ